MLHLTPGKIYTFRFVEKYDEYRCFNKYSCEINYDQEEFDSDIIVVDRKFLNKNFQALFVGGKLGLWDCTSWFLLPIAINKIVQVEIQIPEYTMNDITPQF
jgi:hypothetical protein